MLHRSRRRARLFVVVVSAILVLQSAWVAPPPASGRVAPTEASPAAPVASHAAIPDTTLRVSESSDGDQGNGLSGTAYISADGRFVAFHSSASTLVAGDTNGVIDAFVRDMLTGETTRISVSTAGAQGNGNSTEPSISGDGRYVVFQSVATNLVASDTNAKRDIFVHDRATGVTQRVSLDSSGDQGNNTSTEPVLSFDGRYVAFASDASDLVAGDTNGKSDIFVHDRATDLTTRVSLDSSGAQGNGHSNGIALSDDASIVVFDSVATNLVASDTNAKRDIFVRDRTAGSTVRVSVDSLGAQSDGNAENPSVSGDGRYVAFDSVATNLVSGDTNAAEDVFAHDRVAASTERVSVDSAEAQASGGDSSRPSISDDGRWVAFQSDATNLVSSDSNAVRDVFLRDRSDGVTSRVSLAYNGSQADGSSAQSELAAADGRSVVFKSAATNLIVGDTNAADDVFVRQPADRLDETNLGLQPQHTLESWDLGSGDSLAVNVATGNLVVSHPIVSLPIRGSSLSLSLTYNSQDASDVGLGRGWQLNLQRRLLLNADGSVTLVDADGARHTFSDPQTSGTVTTYTRPERLYGELVKDTSASSEFTLTYRDLSVDHFAISGGAALLVRAEDRFGNGVDLAYAAGTTNLSTLTDPNSRQLSFSWDTAPAIDRLSSLSDWVYISSGVVQTGSTGSLRSYRFFYDADGQLAGWSDPLNTSGSCPTGGSHLTCLSYSAGLLTALEKSQTVTTFSSGTLGSTTRVVSTHIAHAVGRVASVTDAEQSDEFTPQPTSFSLVSPNEVLVERPTTTTRYELVAAHDPFARVAASFRVVDATTDIERVTTWDSDYPIEPASITDNAGAVLDAPARSVSYTYLTSSLGLLAKVVEPLSATTDRWSENTYNANNDLTQAIVSQDGSGSLRNVTRFCYDAGCNLTGSGLSLLKQIDNYVSGGAVDDDTNVSTEYTSDAYGQVTSVTRHNRDAAGGVLDDREDRFSFDANGNLTAEIVNYADGTVSSPGDDITPNVTSGARSDLTTTHTYDTAGNRVSSADSRRAIEAARGTSLGSDDFISRQTFDALNQPLTATTPTTPGLASTQASSASAYDEFGLVRTATDFGGVLSATEYDRAGRAVRSFEQPAGGSASLTSVATFDIDGRPLSAKDRRQAADSSLGQTTFAYDALGRETSVTEATGTSAEQTRTTEWDGLGRDTALEVGVGSPASIRSEYQYDLGGRTTVTDSGISCTIEVSDYRDMPTSTTSGRAGGTCASAGNERTLDHTYDGLGRLTRSEVTVGADLGDRIVDDTFDALGNRRSAAVRIGGVTRTTTFSLNRLDQGLVETRPDGSSAKASFDPVGNALDRCYWAPGLSLGACQPVGSTPWSDPPTQVTSAAYDARNQRISLTDAAAGSITTYDPDHNYAPAARYRATAAGREQQTLYAYDARHRLTGITFQTCSANGAHACTDTPVSSGSDSYAYDEADNRSQVAEHNGSASSDYRYCYDARNQLSFRNSGAACSSSANDEAWTYDEAGNRLSATSGATTTNFAYDAAGLLCDAESGSAASCSGGNVGSDTAGRIESWNGWTFAYDAEGRLTSACQSATCAAGYDKLAFTYDGEGHRTQIVATDAASTVTTTDFRYQNDAVVEERVNGTVVRQFVTDEDGSISKLIVPAGQTDAGTYLVSWNGHGDALNLLRVNSDGSTTLANSFTYDSWGTPTTATHNAISDLGFRYLYVGQFDVQWDDTFGLGLHYMHARHYSTALGRFLQPDPARAELNPHGYARNNPVSAADSAGLLTWSSANITLVTNVLDGVNHLSAIFVLKARLVWNWKQQMVWAVNWSAGAIPISEHPFGLGNVRSEWSARVKSGWSLRSNWPWTSGNVGAQYAAQGRFRVWMPGTNWTIFEARSDLLFSQCISFNMRGFGTCTSKDRWNISFPFPRPGTELMAAACVPCLPLISFAVRPATRLTWWGSSS